MNMDFVDLTVESDDERRINIPPSIHEEETLLLAPDIINPKNIKTEKGPFINIFDTVKSAAAEPRPSTSTNWPTAEPNPSTSKDSPAAEQILFTSTNSSMAEQNPTTSMNSSTAEPKTTMPDDALKAEPNLTASNNSSTAEPKPSTSNNSPTAEQNLSTSNNSLTNEPKPTTSDTSSKAKKKNRRRKSKKTVIDSESSSENDKSNSDSEKDTTSKKSSKAKKKNRKRKGKETDQSCSEDDSAQSENDGSDTTSEASSESKPKKKKRKPARGKKSESKKKEKQRSFIKEAIQDMKSESIDDDLAKIWDEILKKGLQDKKRELLQQFSYPENCKLLRAPILNYITIFHQEMKINKATKEADNVVRRRQDQLGLGIGAIGRVINLLAELKNEKVKKSIQILTNAGQILADVHYSETEARKRAFFPKENHKIIDQLERDDTLFGHNVFNLGLRPPASSANFFIHGPNKNK